MAAYPLFLLPSSLLAATAANECHNDDHAALVAIDTNLGSPYHFASWMPDSACCDWYDVDCDAEMGRVIGLRVFQDANMSGTIPEAIANLSYLHTLTLYHLPAIFGVIPNSLAALSNLSHLTISYTGVSGPLSSLLGMLTLLYLSYKSLARAIPASLADLPNLSGLNLRRKRLSGAIPSLLLSKSPDHAYLWLSSKNLSGAIPAEFAAVKFAHVDVSCNALTSDVACLFGAGKCGNVACLPTMDLQQFNVSFNRLCGEVHAGGNMARFDRYSYLHNKCLCGAPLTT